MTLVFKKLRLRKSDRDPIEFAQLNGRLL